MAFVSVDMTFHDVVSPDDKVVVATGLSGSEIIAGIAMQNIMIGPDAVSDEDRSNNKNVTVENSCITSAEALSMMGVLKDFLLEHPVAPELMSAVDFFVSRRRATPSCAALLRRGNK